MPFKAINYLRGICTRIFGSAADHANFFRRPGAQKKAQGRDDRHLGVNALKKSQTKQANNNKHRNQKTKMLLGWLKLGKNSPWHTGSPVLNILPSAQGARNTKDFEKIDWKKENFLGPHYRIASFLLATTSTEQKIRNNLSQKAQSRIYGTFWVSRSRTGLPIELRAREILELDFNHVKRRAKEVRDGKR
jgi:hypothetical protein